MTTIQLDEKDAELFKLFRQHQDNIAVMIASGAFDMTLGSVEIHFDMQGKIGMIKGHPMLYKRDSMIVVT